MILVEGTTEQFMVPAFAEALGFNLVDYGVSVINVNHLAFKRFTKAFTREGEFKNLVPVAVVTDADKKLKSQINAPNDAANKISWHYGLTVEDEPVKSAVEGLEIEKPSATFEKIILATQSDPGALYKLYRKAYKDLYNDDLPEGYEDAYKKIEKKKAPLAQMVSIYILEILNDDNIIDRLSELMDDTDELDIMPTREELVKDVKKLFPNIHEAIKHASQFEESTDTSDVADNDNR